MSVSFPVTLSNWTRRCRNATISPRRSSTAAMICLGGSGSIVQPVHPLVVHRRRGLPAGQKPGRGLIDLHAERPACAERVVAGGPPHLHGQIPVRARGERAEHIHFREELKKVPESRRTRFHKVPAI